MKLERTGWKRLTIPRFRDEDTKGQEEKRPATGRPVYKASSVVSRRAVDSTACQLGTAVHPLPDGASQVCLERDKPLAALGFAAIPRRGAANGLSGL